MNRFKGRPTEQSLHRKASVEQSLLQELLPKAALLLLSTLPNFDKDVVIFLVFFSHNALLTADPSNTVRKLPLKHWKGSSWKGSPTLKVCPSCTFSDSLACFFPLMEEIMSREIPVLTTMHKAGSSCDCFSTYAAFWSRWNTSPNRDTMSKILEIVESSPQVSEITPNTKGRKKKKVDRKRGLSEKKLVEEVNLDSEMVLSSRDRALNDEDPTAFKLEGPSSDSLVDVDLHTSIAVEVSPILRERRAITTPGEVTRECKKRLFRSPKKKDKSSVSSLSATCEAAGGAPSTAPIVLSGLGESENHIRAVAIEMPENWTPDDVSPSSSSGHYVAVSQGKNISKLQQHHRFGKLRSNQVLPLDCEEVKVASEREQEAIVVTEDGRIPISPRIPDVGLGGRGFLARVFPDTLGRVASRLWDLIYFRLHSYSVEYH